MPLEGLQRRIQGVIDRKGGIEILQLSGGEPTLHPRFFELVDWIQSNSGIDYLLLNTNGVRIAHDDDFLAGLERVVRRGKFQLYLQFDGVQLEGQHSLRGADLRATRRRAIERYDRELTRLRSDLSTAMKDAGPLVEGDAKETLYDLKERRNQVQKDLNACRGSKDWGGWIPR